MRPVLFALALLPLAACGPKSEPQAPAENPPAPPPAAAAPSAEPAPAAAPAQPAPESVAPPAPATPAPAVVPKAAPSAVKPPVAQVTPVATGDVENGRKQFAVCRSCHTIVEGGANMIGPNLHGVFGRQAGSKPGYAYSDAMKAAGFSWNAARMEGWLADPKGYLPGNKMTFIGVRDAKNRADLVAFLQAETR